MMPTIIFITLTPVSSLLTPAITTPSDLGVDYWKINIDSAAIIVGETCNDAHNGAGILDGKAIAVFYVLENGSNNGNLTCVD